jgi:hypothetical protein
LFCASDGALISNSAAKERSFGFPDLNLFSNLRKRAVEFGINGFQGRE